MRKILLLLFLLSPVLAKTQVAIQGIILDSVTFEPIPFVNISVKGTSKGTSTSLQGKFKLEVSSFPVAISVSSVGYLKKEISVTNSINQKIYLVPSSLQLQDAVVIAGYDPALELMKKVVNHSALNNPEKNGSFSYTSYNKMVFTLDTDSLEWSELKTKAKDEEEKKMYRFFEKQHLFMSECVSERKFMPPGKNKETVVASKVSGFSLPVFNLVSTQFQSFHFYLDEIALSDVKYVGPISNHGLNFYNFSLVDTFYFDLDTIYALYFSPKNENSTKAMKGVLQIHSDGYAIYNVIAEPYRELETGFGIKIMQQYEKIENTQWFPTELRTRLILYNAKIGEKPVTGIGTGLIQNINLHPNFTKKDFDEFETVISDQINSNENSLQKYRTDSLNQKEIETYRVIDSLGQKHKLDLKVRALQSLFSGYVPVKFLDWDISKLLNYNDYEGLRLGISLRTNHKISKYISLGGYLAYGFGDKAFKSGTDLNIRVSEKKQFDVNFSFKNDVEASSSNNFFDQQRNLFTEGYSSMFANRFDSVQRLEARVSFRALEHFKINIFGNFQDRFTWKEYAYQIPLANDINYYDEHFQIAELGAELKILINEKFVQTPFGYLSTGSKWPLIRFRYTQGVKGIYGSEFDYSRYLLRIDYKISDLRFGNFNFLIQAGKVLGEVPYHLLFNPSGTYKPIKNMTVYSIDGFETMRVNEFLCDQFTSLHFKYRLPFPLINGKKFRPLLSLTQTILAATSINNSRHNNLTYQEINGLFSESGLVVDNILKSGLSGFGIGAFYRWGNSQLPTFRDNIAVKISLSLALS